MPVDKPRPVKKPWYFYLIDEGIIHAYRGLMKLPRIGPAIRVTFKLSVITTILWMLDAARQPFAPSDWVEVTVENVPKGLRHFYLIADGPEGIRAIEWYASMVFVFTVGPADFAKGWRGDRSDDRHPSSVQWPEARRLGALAQRSDGSWLLWWLNDDDREGPSISRYLVGRGEARIRLPDESRAVTPSQELRDQVGVEAGEAEREAIRKAQSHRNR